jgi:hypothetical protein
MLVFKAFSPSPLLLNFSDGCFVAATRRFNAAGGKFRRKKYKNLKGQCAPRINQIQSHQVAFGRKQISRLIAGSFIKLQSLCRIG